MKQYETAYLAGVFDGEGYVGIQHNQHGWTVQVLVRTTGSYLPNLFLFSFGGSVRSYKRKDIPKLIWTWTVSDSKALSFLTSILPYSKLKRPQIELAIKFQQRKQLNKSHGKNRLPIEETVLREAEMILMKKLKEDSYIC